MQTHSLVNDQHSLSITPGSRHLLAQAIQLLRLEKATAGQSQLAGTIPGAGNMATGWQDRPCPPPRDCGCRGVVAGVGLLMEGCSGAGTAPGTQGESAAGPPGGDVADHGPPLPTAGCRCRHGTSRAIEQGVFAGAQPARCRRTQCTLCPGHEQLRPIHSGLIAPQARVRLCWCRRRRWPPAATRVR